MALTLSDKKSIVVEMADLVSKASSVVVVDCSGLKVPEMTALRQAARRTGVKLSVVKNSLSKRALQSTAFECLADALVQSSCLAFSQDDPGAAPRLFRDFIKTAPSKLKIKGIAIGGKLYSSQALDTLASLPTRPEALACLLGVMKAPIVRLAQTLKETQGKFVRTVAAVRDKKQAAFS